MHSVVSFLSFSASSRSSQLLSFSASQLPLSPQLQAFLVALLAGCCHGGLLGAGTGGGSCAAAPFRCSRRIFVFWRLSKNLGRPHYNGLLVAQSRLHAAQNLVTVRSAEVLIMLDIIKLDMKMIVCLSLLVSPTLKNWFIALYPSFGCTFAYMIKWTGYQNV